MRDIITEYNGGKRSFVRVGLNGVDLPDANLRGADLCNANLRTANLCNADLRNANLRGANLCNADLRTANLCYANLCNANWRDADLCNADLRGADLRNANLRNANLRNANLRNADLRNANLRSADLRNANLRGADLCNANLNYTRLPAFQIPQEGELVVWKKLQGGTLAKCVVPREAKRTAFLTGRKCRAEFVYVLELFNPKNCSAPLNNGWAIHDGITEYIPGSWVYPDSYDPDIRVECTHGIHFFLIKEEAEEYHF